MKMKKNFKKNPKKDRTETGFIVKTGGPSYETDITL